MATFAHCASIAGNIDIIEHTIRTSAGDLWKRDSLGCLPIYYAAMFGHALIVKRLVEHDKDFARSSVIFTGVNEKLFDVAELRDMLCTHTGSTVL